MPSSHITWHSDLATATGARVPEGIMAIVAASRIRRLCNHMLTATLKLQRYSVAVQLDLASRALAAHISESDYF